MKIAKYILISSLCAVIALSISACGGSSGASKKEIVDNLVERTEGSLLSVLSKEDIRKLYECIFDEAYGDLSTSTRNGLAEITSLEDTTDIQENMSDKERKAFSDAQNACRDVVDPAAMAQTTSSTTAPTT